MTVTRHMFIQALVLLTLASLTATPYADTIALFGQSGGMGIAGDEGLPGGAGENGWDAAIGANLDNHVDTSVISLEASAGYGGDGGQGGDALEGQASGGNGGNGGDGGSALSESRLEVTDLGSDISVVANGGGGGHGGAGGAGFPDVSPDGVGGNGGRGGNAEGVLIHAEDQMTGFQFPGFNVDSRGGTGGNAVGQNARAGNGGDATSIGELMLTSDENFTTSLSLGVQGGNGGDGIGGADAGDGGIAELDAVVINVGSNGAIDAAVTVVGGSGGEARRLFEMPSGDGGDGASVWLNNSVVTTGNILNIVQNASGGDGGSTSDGAVGRAGSAASEMILQDIDTGEQLDLSAGAVGGAGGDRTNDTGVAGVGADAASYAELDSGREDAAARASSRGGVGGRGFDGARGGDGGNAVAESVLRFSATVPDDFGISDAIAYGANGGSASGANALQGSTGGEANALSSVTSLELNTVRARSRAFGGDGGAISSGTGFGGHGTTAAATALASGQGRVTADASATGGSGSIGRGVGYRGGDGAQATVSANAESSTTFATAVASTSSRGGFGGLGEQGADSGNGADVFLENTATGSNTGDLELRQSAIAGWAGSVFGGGDAGLAGNAETNADVFHSGTQILVRDQATGGKGGFNLGGGSASSGGYGRASGHVVALQDAFLHLSVVGGRGGDTQSGHVAGDGGDAVIGSAIVRAAGDASIQLDLEAGLNGVGQEGQDASPGSIVFEGDVFAESTSGGAASVEITANGSGALGGGTARDVILDNVARGQTSGELILRQTARAGNSVFYNLARSNEAANAVASLSRSANLEYLGLENTAYGGSGPVAMEGAAGSGGTANAVSEGENSGGNVGSGTTAFGGKGGGGYDGADSGAGGMATANSVANTTASDANATAYSTAIGGDAGLGTEGSITAQGGAGQSNSQASAVGVGTARATSYATGGDGSNGSSQDRPEVSGDGGDALSTAEATAQFGEATALADSIGGQSGFFASSGGNTGNAHSVAVATSDLSAVATANSSNALVALGAGARNTSNATANAQTASATARSFSNGSGPVGSIRAYSHNAGHTQASSQTTIAIGTVTEQDMQAGLQGSSATVIALPDTGQVDTLLENYDNVADDFDVGGDSDVLGFVNLGVGSNEGQSADDALYEASVSATINISGLSINQNLILGLLDFEVGDAGIDNVTFQIDIENEIAFEQVFTSVLELESFFVDRTMDFGLIADLAGSGSNLDLEISIFMDTPLANTGFAFTAIFGNSTLDIAAVPLPAGVWLFVSALGMLAVGRRRSTFR